MAVFVNRLYISKKTKILYDIIDFSQFFFTL